VVEADTVVRLAERARYNTKIVNTTALQ
jgi:hypothetical protein